MRATARFHRVFALFDSIVLDIVLFPPIQSLDVFGNLISYVFSACVMFHFSRTIICFYRGFCFPI